MSEMDFWDEIERLKRLEWAVRGYHEEAKLFPGAHNSAAASSL